MMFIIPPLPDIANYSTKYLILSKVYTSESGMKIVIPRFTRLYEKNPLAMYHALLSVREIIHELKLVNYILVQADKPWCNYYLLYMNKCASTSCEVIARDVTVA